MSPALPLPGYQKPWKSYEDQVALLQQRGLAVTDANAAVRCLCHMNYYRFSGYCLAFEQARHQFPPGTTFEQICAAYEFDRDLRDLVTEALEVVEVDLRTGAAYHFGKAYGAFGHTQCAHFFHGFRHADWMDKLHEETERSSELFVTHFKRTYREFPDLPVWVMTEIMSFGALSKMCEGMLREDQKKLAARYGLQPSALMSWMHHLVYVRNLCAHHARLWDRVWSIKPELPRGAAWQPPSLAGNQRLFATLLILNYMMRHCQTMAAFAADWRQRVQNLMDAPPAAPRAMELMELGPNWAAHTLWR